jgi:predicted transcriptional regulator
LENNQNYGSITAKKIQKYITDDPVILNLKVTDVKELPFPEVEKSWNVKDISSLLLNYPAVLVKDNKNFIGIITDSNFLKLTSY